jgi:serpin B
MTTSERLILPRGEPACHRANQMHFLSRRGLLLGASALAALGLMRSRARGTPSSDEVPQDVLALTSAYNESGHQLFAEFVRSPGNFVFSPFSIGTAMAMALSGARGATEQELINVLKHHLTRPQIEAASEKTIALLKSRDRSSDPHLCPQTMQWTGEQCESSPVNGRCPSRATLEEAKCLANPDRPSARLLVANALFATKGAQDFILPDYVSLVREKYAGEIFHDASVAQINDWVRQKTEGKIDRILDALPPAAAALLNAIYFQAAWAHAFEKRSTRQDDFNLSSGVKIKVPTMHQTETFSLATGLGYRAIRLPFSVSSLSLVVVRPDEIEGLADVEHRFTAAEQAKLFEIFAVSQPTPVSLALPKFKAAFETNLSRPFRDAGLNLAFSKTQADFTGMANAGSGFCIDEILHRAIIDVTEGGVAAAAVTAIKMFLTAAVEGVSEPKYEPFIVDRPFLFFIFDEMTRAILFAGRVSDPTKSA